MARWIAGQARNDKHIARNDKHIAPHDKHIARNDNAYTLPLSRRAASSTGLT
jgi:hypothetical protein